MRKGQNMFPNALKTVVVFILLVFLAAFASAQTVVELGYTQFTTVDGGDRDCRIKDWHVACNLADAIPDLLGVNPWVAFSPVMGLSTLEPFPYAAIRTLSNPSTKVIGAAFTNFGFVNWANYSQLGIPHYASSWLYKDIKIDDPSNTGSMVDVQISISYDWEGGIAGLANYEGRFSLSIEVEDITEASSPVGVGSFDLVSRDRSGDQGVTDVASGGTTYDRNNDTNHFQITLEQGRSYRIYFKAEAYGSPLVSGVESSVRAMLHTIGLNISTSTDASDLIAAHDEDMKAMLEGIMNELEDIKKLLNTPNGRRPDFPSKTSKTSKNRLTRPIAADRN